MNQFEINRHGLPWHLVHGATAPETKRYEVRGYSQSGIVTVYWWVEATSRLEALEKAKAGLAGYSVSIVVKD